MTRLPPPDRDFVWVEIRREVGMSDFEVLLPNGDSYDLDYEEVKLYLVRLLVPTLNAEKTLDKVWNFYAIRLHLDGLDYRIETLEPPHYPEVSGPRPLEEFAWVIEGNRIL